MKLDPKIRALLEEERFDAIEDVWMSRLEDSPGDLDFFASTLRGLLQRQQEERAELLLQLFLEARAQRDDADTRLVVVKHLLRLWPESATLRTALVDNLRRLYADSPNLERLLEHFRLAETADPREVLEPLLTWLRFDVGSPVYLRTQGTGRVSELNLSLSTLRVQFLPSREVMSFRLGEAEHLLEPLGREHFLVQKLEALDELQKLAQDDPGELLRRLFASFGNSLPSADVRAHLEDVVATEAWNSWWKRARQDPRLTVGAGSRPRCTWSDSAAQAEDQLLARFAQAGAAERLEIARKHVSRSEALAQDLVAGLSSSLSARDTEPSQALEIHLFLEQLQSGEKQERDAMLQRDDAALLLQGIRDRRTRERGLQALRALRPDWPAVFQQVLESESDARTLAFLYEAMREATDLDVLDRLVTETLMRPSRAPRFFIWLCREMPLRPELQSRADWRFLRRLLDACSDPAFKGQHTSLRQLFDGGGLVDRIVEGLEPEQAAQLLLLLQREVGLEEHRKKELRDFLELRFPQLRERRDTTIYVSAAALERKRDELEQLMRVDIPRNTEEIRRAAAHGDLRENFEYHAARQRQEMLSSRAKTLHDELQRTRALDPAAIDGGAVRVGTRVQLIALHEDRTPIHLTILGPWDSDPAQGIVSYMAPAVGALLGKRVGDAVRFGEQDFRVASIEVWRP